MYMFGEEHSFESVSAGLIKTIKEGVPSLSIKGTKFGCVPVTKKLNPLKSLHLEPFLKALQTELNVIVKKNAKAASGESAPLLSVLDFDAEALGRAAYDVLRDVLDRLEAYQSAEAGDRADIKERMVGSVKIKIEELIGQIPYTPSPASVADDESALDSAEDFARVSGVGETTILEKTTEFKAHFEVELEVFRRNFAQPQREEGLDSRIITDRLEATSPVGVLPSGVGGVGVSSPTAIPVAPTAPIPILGARGGVRSVPADAPHSSGVAGSFVPGMTFGGSDSDSD